MKITSLRDGMRRVDVVGTIESVDAPRTVSLRAGGQSDVADAILRDETGSIKVPLWNEDIGKVKRGAVVSIQNGYTTNFRGELQLSVGKYGRLIVQADGSDPDEPVGGLYG